MKTTIPLVDVWETWNGATPVPGVALALMVPAKNATFSGIVPDS